MEDSTQEIDPVSFDDVGGLDDIVLYLKRVLILPQSFEKLQKFKNHLPRGILLHGPPGCGKTLLAKAVANAFGGNFFLVSGPELMSKYVGESELQLREVFQNAADSSLRTEKISIIFFDEIDAVAIRRDSVDSDIAVRFVAQLLVLLDGVRSRGNVVVMAATNRPHALDPAIRRPGRFDYDIEIKPPNFEGRKQIILINAKKIDCTFNEEEVNSLASETVGYTGADLSGLFRTAVQSCLERSFAFKNGNFIQVEEEVHVTINDLKNSLKKYLKWLDRNHIEHHVDHKKDSHIH